MAFPLKKLKNFRGRDTPSPHAAPGCLGSLSRRNKILTTRVLMNDHVNGEIGNFKLSLDASSCETNTMVA